jgi:hypothetical protein
MDTQQTQNNIEDIQMDPFINPPNIVIDDIGDITLELSVGPYTITNTSAPQVANPSPSSSKATKLEKLAKGDSTSHHTPISQYLQCPRPLIPKVPMGSRLIVVATSMNPLQPPIEDSSTCQIT